MCLLELFIVKLAVQRYIAVAKFCKGLLRACEYPRSPIP